MIKTNIFNCEEFIVAHANYFSVSPLQYKWGPRTIDDYELIYQLSGSSVYLDESGVSKSLLKNEILLIPPDIEHTFICDIDSRPAISCVHFSPVGGKDGIAACTYRIRDDFEVLHLFKKVFRELHSGEKYSNELLSLALTEICIRISRSQAAIVAGSNNPLVQKALEFIDENCLKGINRSSVADYMNITPEYLNLLFRRHLKTSPLTCIRRKQLNRALHLLQSKELSILDICERCGFQDQFYFSRFFKKMTGLSPHKYRSTL